MHLLVHRTASRLATWLTLLQWPHVAVVRQKDLLDKHNIYQIIQPELTTVWLIVLLRHLPNLSLSSAPI